MVTDTPTPDLTAFSELTSLYNRAQSGSVYGRWESILELLTSATEPSRTKIQGPYPREILETQPSIWLKGIP